VPDRRGVLYPHRARLAENAALNFAAVVLKGVVQVHGGQHPSVAAGQPGRHRGRPRPRAGPHRHRAGGRIRRAPSRPCAAPPDPATGPAYPAPSYATPFGRSSAVARQDIYRRTSGYIRPLSPRTLRKGARHPDRRAPSRLGTRQAAYVWLDGTGMAAIRRYFTLADLASPTGAAESDRTILVQVLPGRAWLLWSEQAGAGPVVPVVRPAARLRHRNVTLRCPEQQRCHIAVRLLSRGRRGHGACGAAVVRRTPGSRACGSADGADTAPGTGFVPGRRVTAGDGTGNETGPLTGQARRPPSRPLAGRRPERREGQAVTACLVSLLVTWILRGLAASWTGTVRVSTPAA
jgi:hypothetical protein